MSKLKVRKGVSRGAVRAQLVEAGTRKQGCGAGLRCTVSMCIHIPHIPLCTFGHVVFPITHLLLTSSSLPPDDDMLQESGIYTGQVMLLELKKDDGTWPRETYVSQSSMVSCVFSVYASLNFSTEHCCMVNIALLCTVFLLLFFACLSEPHSLQ